MKLRKFIVLLFLLSLFLSKEETLAAVNNVNKDMASMGVELTDVTANVDNVPIQVDIDIPQVKGLIPFGEKAAVIKEDGKFYQVEYNGVIGWISKAYTKEGATTSLEDYIAYKQMGQTWSGIKYSSKNIGTSGCGPTSAAICISGLGDDLNPGELVESGYEAGYTSFVAGTYSNRLLLNIVGYNLSENVGSAKALDYLAEGNPIICHAGPGFYTSYGHFMALVGVKGNEVYLSDPYSYREARNGWIDINMLMSRGVDAFYVVTAKN